MATGSVDCIVTSPPYWAKRDYGAVGQYGHEPDQEGYVDTLRGIFREVRRVLTDDGTCWLNLGDSYSRRHSSTGIHPYRGPNRAGRQAPGMGTKNLFGLPWRVAWRCRTTAGSCATRSSGTSPTRCPNRSGTGFLPLRTDLPAR